MQYKHLKWCAIIMMGTSSIMMSKPLDGVKTTHGNLALPTSQQPGPLFSFGQNIVDEQDVLVYEYVNYINAQNRKITQSVTSLLYGLSEHASLFISIPVMTGSVYTKHVRGMQDIIVQGEYAWYTYSSEQREFMATLVANISFPTAKNNAILPLGLGSIGFFAGITASYTGATWYAFTSYGVGLPTKGEGITVSKQFLYQMGIGYNIDSQASDYIALLMLEMDGIYNEKDKMHLVHHRSGNSFFIIPSLWFSTERFTAQFGYAGLITPQDDSAGNKEHYRLLAYVGWKF